MNLKKNFLWHLSDQPEMKKKYFFRLSEDLLWLTCLSQDYIEKSSFPEVFFLQLKAILCKSKSGFYKKSTHHKASYSFKACNRGLMQNIDKWHKKVKKAPEL